MRKLGDIPTTAGAIVELEGFEYEALLRLVTAITKLGATPQELYWGEEPHTRPAFELIDQIAGVLDMQDSMSRPLQMRVQRQIEIELGDERSSPNEPLL